MINSPLLRQNLKPYLVGPSLVNRVILLSTKPRANFFGSSRNLNPFDAFRILFDPRRRSSFHRFSGADREGGAWSLNRRTLRFSLASEIRKTTSS